MWYKEYRDYKPDEPLVKEEVGPGKGIVGCEMHEINGWGNNLHQTKKRKKGLVGTLLESFFGWFNSK